MLTNDSNNHRPNSIADNSTSENRPAYEPTRRIEVPAAPERYLEAALRVSNAAAETDEYLENQLSDELFYALPECFKSGVWLTTGTRNALQGAYPGVDPLALAQAAWNAAIENDAFRREGADRVAFALPLPRLDDSTRPAELTVARTTDENASVGRPWYAPHVFLKKRSIHHPAPSAAEQVETPIPDAAATAPATEAPEAGAQAEDGEAHYHLVPLADKPAHAASHGTGRTLIDFAYIGSINKLLSTLADRAPREEWSLQAEPLDHTIGSERGLLMSYLNATFLSASRQGLVLENAWFAAFNTGLRSRIGSELFVCFTKTPETSHINKPWTYDGVCEPGVGSLGKTLLRKCEGRVPKAPSYPRIELDGPKPIYVDFQHVITERAHRLPAELFKGTPAEALRAQATRIRPVAELEATFRQLEAELMTDQDAFDTVRARLGTAIDATHRLWEQDPSLVAAGYNVNRDQAHLLLPVWATESAKPSFVLYAESLPGCLQAHTILTPQMTRCTLRTLGPEMPWWLNGEECERRREWILGGGTQGHKARPGIAA